MRRLLLTSLSLLLLLSLTVTAVFAQNPHFVGPVRFTDNGTTLTATGSIAGLGNQNVDVQLAATGTATIDCRNPGGNIAPGQRSTVDVSGTVSNLEVKNGRVNFTVTTAEATAPADACPNRKWTPIIRDVEFTSATITVFQPAGSGIVVLQETFTP